MIVFLNGCGVDTSSSPSDSGSVNTTTDVVNSGVQDDLTGLDLINSNPIIDPTTSNPIDTNTTDGNTTTDTDTPVVIADQNNSIFDVTGAVLDSRGCMIGDSNDGFTSLAISDSSADDTSGEDISYGVLISSKYPFDRVSPERTEVALFYYTLKPQRDMTMINIYEDRYKLSVDTAWGKNDETVMYVMTPKDINDLYGCYRYEFSGIADGSFTRTKVYRNN